MTMPHLTNCPHQGEGWCLGCVGDLQSSLDLARQSYDAAVALLAGAMRGLVPPHYTEKPTHMSLVKGVDFLVHRLCLARTALERIKETGHNPSFQAPDLCGLPDRYEQLADRLAVIANEALAWMDGSVVAARKEDIREQA